MHKIIKRIKDAKRISIMILHKIVMRFSPILATKYIHYAVLGRKLNLDDPQTLNDKMQWLNLNYNNPLKTECADKYKVRDYVKNCGYGNLLNELYGVYDKAIDIDWDKLPDKFVLKCNHGSGFNITCRDKSKLNKKQTVRRLNKWMRMDYSKHLNERHYKNISHKIICEKYLGSEKGKLPLDYKIYCFNGCAKIILICKDREFNLKYGLFDLEWNILPYLKPSNDASKELKNKKPLCLDQMLKCAEKLSKPFPFVRVDFYIIENKLIFGEMTFSPSGCLDRYNEGLQKLDDMINIKNLI